MKWKWFFLFLITLLVPSGARGQASYLIFNHAADCNHPDEDDLGLSGSDSDQLENIGSTQANLWICVYDQTTFTFHGESSACGRFFSEGAIRLYNAETSTIIEELALYDTSENACLCDGTGIVVDRTLDTGYYRLMATANAGYWSSCQGGSLSTVAVQKCESFCTNGTEVLADRTPLYAGDTWTGSGTGSGSGYSNQRVRFTYFVPSGGTATLLGEINGESGTINASGSISQSTIIPSEAVSGPTANITLTHQNGSRADLMSVCLLDAGGTTTETDECIDCVAGRVAQVRQPNAPLLFQGIPSEGLLPWEWENVANEWGNPLARLCMNFDFLWKVAQIALAFYNLVGADGAWPIILSFLIILIGVSVLYKILIRPPDI